MSSTKLTSTIDAAATQLRSIVLETEEGALIGSEETLVAKLGVSRSTVRQVARLLEREGLLKVRRGINGGYFASRPDVHTIESTVSAYLEMVHTEPEDVTVVASVLWVEVLRRAARVKSAESKALSEKYSAAVSAVKPEATFDEVLSIERESRKAIFDLINSRYIELIFQINTVFSKSGQFAHRSDKDGTETQRRFVEDWRRAKLLEFASIEHGDVELASVAARHGRNIWHRRIWGHDMR